MITRKVVAILLACVLSFSLFSCASSSTSNTNPTTKTTEGSEGAAKEEAKSDTAASGSSGKLSIWSWGADAEKVAREEAVKVFEQAHPEYQIEHIVLPTADSVWDQKSAAAYAAGNAGDVMQMSPDYYGLMSKYYENLSPYIEKEDVNLEEVTVPGVMNGYYSPDGKLEAMPLLANVFLFAYNMDMFDAVGVPYPTDDWTWDDFAAMAPKFASGEGVNQTYAIVSHWVTGNFGITAKGGAPYTSDFTTLTLDTPEVAAGLDLFGDLVKQKAMPDSIAAKNLPAVQLFASGKAAVYPMGGFEAASVVEQVGNNFRIGAVLPPKASGTDKNTNVTYATGYAMNVASKNKDAAWQFLKETTYANDDMAKATATSGMPANKKIAESIFANMSFGDVKGAKYVAGLATSMLNPFGGALATVGDQWRQMWEDATINGTSGKEAQDKFFSLAKKAWDELEISTTAQN